MIFNCVRCSPILYHSARDLGRGAILNTAHASIIDVTVTSQTDCPRAACRHGSSDRTVWAWLQALDDVVERSAGLSFLKEGCLWTIWTCISLFVYALGLYLKLE